jgi:hypothetical protein
VAAYGDGRSLGRNEQTMARHRELTVLPSLVAWSETLQTIRGSVIPSIIGPVSTVTLFSIIVGESSSRRRGHTSSRERGRRDETDRTGLTSATQLG